ncbi:DUF927 domain-containing protein [Pseudanabaena sp. PCC 6802]|uniref:DUF927 domain-containing protein n=1 Tax=Pseudanabaena sp. PCC 6802 TaxID=118173 RepID=UPI00034A0302|nr:DUF927 domain-containing protein [Pseudanabaena sp. PCC 6802]
MINRTQKWIYSSATNPCPICDRVKDGDCRISQDGGLVLCHSEVNGRVKGEQLGNYIWIGSISEPMDWGKWITPNLEPRKNPDHRPTGKTYRFDYQNESGEVACTKVRIYQKQNDGSVKKKDWWEPKGVDSASLLPYRYAEAIAALKADPTLPLLIDESEMTCDELWQRGVPAIAFGRSLKPARIKKLLSGYESCLVICIDQDEPGIRKAAKYQKIFPMAATLRPYPESDFWLPEWLPESGGLDVRDWILENNLSKDKVLEAIQQMPGKRSPEQPQATDSDKFEGGKPHFWSTPEQGLVWESYEKDDDGNTQRSRTRIGNHLQAIAYINSPDGDGAALLLEFKNQQGHLCRWTMPRRALGADSGTLIGELLGRGYGLVYEQKRKLARYLTELGTEVNRTYTVTESTGWLNGSFVLPNKTYGDQTLRFRDVEPSQDCPFEIKGTLDGWRSEVAAKCANNSRLIFAKGVAFAGPLLVIVGMESGGFHLVGGTSQGKTTALNVAASVAGIKELPHWRTTTNGLESTATASNHLACMLDEIGQDEPKDVGAKVYMLANGQGKARMRRDLTSARVKTWQLLFLSSGEVGLAAYLKQAGISLKGGQEVRLPDLPAIPKNSQYGVFESIHGYETPVDFVNALERAVKQQHGTALDAYLTQLVEDKKLDGFAKRLTNELFAIAGDLSANYSDAAISRVAKRFALVQVALHLAHSYGLLPFPVEQCNWAVKTMFDDWVNARGGDGSIEIKQALERIEHLFVSNEHSDRIYKVDSKDAQTVRNLLAYRKLDPFEKEVEFWVPNAVFNSEVAKDCDRHALIAELQKKGWLKPPGVDGKPYLGRRIDGKKIRVYVFTQFWSNEKSEVPEVPQVPVSQNADTVKHTDSDELEPSSGSSRFQRFQKDIFDNAVEPLEPDQKSTGSSEVPVENLDNKGFAGSGTPGTCGTHKKQQSLKNTTSEAIEDADEF